MKLIEKKLFTRKKRVYSTGMLDYHVLGKINSYPKDSIVARHPESLSIAVANLQKALNSFSVVNHKNISSLSSSIHVAGINLTIDPLLPSLVNDPFIIEKTKKAELQFSNRSE